MNCKNSYEIQCEHYLGTINNSWFPENMSRQDLSAGDIYS